MPQRYGDFATWTGSIGTVAAFGVGFYQIQKERNHRLKRELEDRLRAKREHADRVSAWFVGDELVVSNTSGHPIHDIEVNYFSPAGAASAPDAESQDAGPDAVIVLALALPGETRIPAPHAHTTQMPAIEFTDSRGDRWRRESGERTPHFLAAGAKPQGRRR